MSLLIMRESGIGFQAATADWRGYQRGNGVAERASDGTEV